MGFSSADPAMMQRNPETRALMSTRLGERHAAMNCSEASSNQELSTKEPIRRLMEKWG
jgi:hypothetical protein